MANITMRLKGADRLTRDIETMAKRYPSAFGRATFQDAVENIFKASQEEVPGLGPSGAPPSTGKLRASGFVDPPIRPGAPIAIGYEESYATEVHEKREAGYHIGKAGYLLDPFLAATPGMAERIAKRTERAVTARKGIAGLIRVRGRSR